MAKRVSRPYEPDRPVPLPPGLRQWLPADHAADLLGDIVDQLDLSPIPAAYDAGDGGGNPPYHPALLTRLLFYADAQGVVSSRVVASKAYEDVAFRVLCTDQHPGFRAISDFRERRRAALAPLFRRVGRLAGRLGLVKLEHVAQDGSKVPANAPKHRAMSHGRMKQAEERPSRETQVLFEAARAAGAAEDARYGAGRSGDELPADLSGEIERRARRPATIRAAKEALEREAQEEAAAIRAADDAARARRAAAGEPQKRGKRPGPSGVPPDDARRNFTDPDSRILKNADKAFVQAYNAQAAADASPHQIIVGCALTKQAADAPHLAPMAQQVCETTGDTPEEWSADAGFFSARSVAVLDAAGIAGVAPPDRQRHSQPPLPKGVARLLTPPEAGPPARDAEDGAEAPAKAAMRAKLQTEPGRAAYAKRKQTVGPVFGQRKERRGLRRFLLRGLAKASGEWTLWCLTHNLRKMVQALRAMTGLRACLAMA
jgi:transposase